jgi:hypothetical protein
MPDEANREPRVSDLKRLQLIGSALALVAPGWLALNGDAASTGEAALLAVRDQYGQSGLVYLDEANRQLTEAEAVLGADAATEAPFDKAHALLIAARDTPGTGQAAAALDAFRALIETDAGPSEGGAELDAARAIADLAHAICRSARTDDDAGPVVIRLVLATLVMCKPPTAEPQVAEAAGDDDAAAAIATSAKDGEMPVLTTLLDAVRASAARELEAAYAVELEDFGVVADAYSAGCEAAIAGRPEAIDRILRAAEQRIVQAAITDMAHARELSRLAARARQIRGWAAATAGAFMAASGHFKLAMRHIATAPIRDRAALLERAIDFAVVASFAGPAEPALLAAREQAAALGTLVRAADTETRLDAAIAIGRVELSVGRGFDRRQTCANVIAFAEKVRAEALLAEASELALAAQLLACRVRLTLAVHFGATDPLPELVNHLTETAAELENLDGGARDGELARLQMLTHACLAIDSQDTGALALSVAELSEASPDTPAFDPLPRSLATAVSDALDGDYLALRVKAAQALGAVDAIAAGDVIAILDSIDAHFGAWLTPALAARLELDRADLLDAETGDSGREISAAIRIAANETLQAIAQP